MLRKGWWVSTVPKLPLLLPFLLTDQKEIILQDVRRWQELNGMVSISALTCLMYFLSEVLEFRNVYFYRIHRGNLPARVAKRAVSIIFRTRESLYLIADEGIGPGLYIEHGFSTVVTAKRIGANAYINQQVTVGYRIDSVGHPIIGDNVRIGAGAKVLGGVMVGNNVTVGANAVVVKDVPANCVVVGVPARIVRRNGIRVNERL
jgi:serine O-acetyltransferase